MSNALRVDACSTYASAQRLLTEAFAQSGIESAALDSRVLLCGALAIDHARLVRDPDLRLGEAASKLIGFAQRRLAHEPVSRILGQREFFGEIYAIDPSVLDPRPDTETLIEAVLASMKPRLSEPLSILDLGTGSGAILGALLGQCPSAMGIGVDLSPSACTRARGNLSALGLSDRAQFISGRWLAALKGRFDIIVSNPPYIISSDIESLDPEVRLHDPRLALDGGDDGLEAYRSIAEAVPAFLAPGGILALELGPGQLQAVTLILAAAGLRGLASRNDLAGRARVILANLGAGLETRA